MLKAIKEQIPVLRYRRPGEIGDGFFWKSASSNLLELEPERLRPRGTIEPDKEGLL